MSASLPRLDRRLASTAVVLAVISFVGAGCASVVKKHAYDFKTTALFPKPCDLPTKRDADPPRLENASKSADQAVAVTDGAATDVSAASVKEQPSPIADPAASRRVQTDAACNGAYMVGMAERFMLIEEADEAKGVAGDTIDDVRRKGFSIFVDRGEKVRRQNTKPLYGADALATVGMGVSPPPLQRPEDVKAYTEFIGQHYAEEYYEKDLTNVTDRFCMNRRESVEIGDDRTFSILWRKGHVIKRVIKGGPVNNPKLEHGFLVCPGQFLSDFVTGRVSGAVSTYTGIK